MNNTINIANKILYPNICLSFDNYNYKKMNEKIKKLNNDFKCFLESNKKKISKSKKNFYSFSINNLFKKLVFDSANKILKNYKKNFEKNNKRFKSANEIQKYKDKKIFLLKLIRKKNININRTNQSFNDKKTLNSISNINYLSNNLISGNDYNNSSSDNIISFLTNRTNRSMKSRPNLKKVFKNKTIENNIRLNRNNIKINEKLFQKQNLNKSSLEIQKNNINDLYLNKMNEKRYNNNYKTINLNKENNINNKKVYKLINKNINLNKLKLSVKKYEKSLDYHPNSDIIHKNSLKPYNFFSKKYLKNNKFNSFYINKKEMNRRINNNEKRKKLYFTKNHQLNKTHLSVQKDNIKIEKLLLDNNKNNIKCLIDKINNIQEEMKIKRKLIKKKSKDKKNHTRKIIKYLKNKNPFNQEIDKGIKKDISSYQKKMGNFIFLEGGYVYTSHLSYFEEGQKFI